MTQEPVIGISDVGPEVKYWKRGGPPFFRSPLTPCSCQFARRNRRWVQIAWCREHMEEAKGILGEKGETA